MASENSYAQLIDDYENGIQVIEGETFDEYQKRMGGIDYNAYGGLTGMGYANGGGVGSMMQPKKNFKMQGGVRNYLGDQKQVKAPLNWQSSPDHPKTELAYITKKEKDLLIKKDLHNSLKGSANKGPSGIISLNGFGSNDPGQNVGGGDISSAETGGGRSGMSQKDAQDFRSAAINAGAGQRVNPGFFDSRTFLSPEETARAKAYRNDPRNTFANQSFRNTGQSGIMNFIKSGGLMGNLVRSLGQRFGFGKKYDDTSTSISEDFNNNLGLGGINTTPTSTRFKDFAPRVGNTNTMPKANITGLSNNDFDGVQNVDRSITSGQIDEFGDNRNINMDEFATQDAIDNRLMQNYLTDQSGFQQPITANQINEFGDNRNINMDEFAGNNMQMQNYLTDQANYNADPLGNPNFDPRVVPEEYGLVGNQEFSLGELINNARPAEFPNTNTIKTPPRLFGGEGATNNELPNNAMFAGNYSQNAVSNQLYGVPYNDLPVFDQQKLDSLIDQVGTKSTGELARNGGIMGYGRG